MRDYLLLLPIIFIFHDMEEIIGFGWFFKNNPWLYNRFPKVMKPYIGWTHEGFAAAVYEEFIPFFGISLLAYYFPCAVLYGLWTGVFLALTGHFLIHIGHSIYIRKFIPCLATSLICLPISIVILSKCVKIIELNFLTIISVIAGILMMIINMKIAYGVLHLVNKKIEKK